MSVAASAACTSAHGASMAHFRCWATCGGISLLISGPAACISVDLKLNSAGWGLPLGSAAVGSLSSSKNACAQICTVTHAVSPNATGRSQRLANGLGIYLPAFPPSLPPDPTLPYPTLPTHLLTIIFQVGCLRRLPRTRQGKGRDARRCTLEAE